jgi:hypothetical protein
VQQSEDKNNLKERAKVYKRRFDARLKHVKVILMAKLKTMSSDEWYALLDETKDAIFKNPSHYLGDNLPSPEVTKEVVNQVFNGFLQDIRVRKVQSFRGPSVYKNILLPRRRS